MKLAFRDSRVRGSAPVCDVEVEIAPGAPPERLEGAIGATVGEKAVGEAKGFAVGDFVAITFVAVFVVEGFGVGEGDPGTFAAGDGELRIGGGEGFAVEEDVDVVDAGIDAGSWEDDEA